jgi:UDP-2,3-diacylglucosamine pyrophosphatase LpxH
MKSKNVKKYIQKYKLFMVNEAIRNNCDGVICGHIHYPEIETIKGIDYYNDGDWVESLSALVEDKKGKLKLVYWKEIK